MLRNLQLERSLPRAEREALHRIRTARAAGGLPAHGPDCPVGRLAAACLAAGLSIARADARLTTIDERLLIVSLALRQRGEAICPPDATLIGPVTEAGAALSGSGVRLPARPGHRILLARHGWATPPRPELPPSRLRRRRRPIREPAPVDRGTARARVIDYARGRGHITSSELRSLGISRQYIGVLLYAGVLDRVTFGFYRLGALIDPS